MEYLSCLYPLLFALTIEMPSSSFHIFLSSEHHLKIAHPEREPLKKKNPLPLRFFPFFLFHLSRLSVSRYRRIFSGYVVLWIDWNLFILFSIANLKSLSLIYFTFVHDFPLFRMSPSMHRQTNQLQTTAKCYPSSFPPFSSQSREKSWLCSPSLFRLSVCFFFSLKILSCSPACVRLPQFEGVK